MGALKAIPANPKLEPAESGKPAVEYFKIQMDNINGSHIYGQLARPKNEGKYAALLIVQYSGVYGLPKGNVVNRTAGFPYWADHAKWTKNDKIVETGRYFDAVNFASHIKCPTVIGLGLIDQTCPPAGVFAACNQFQGPKEVIVLVKSDHQGKNNSQAAYYSRSEVWLRQLLKGEQATPK